MILNYQYRTSTRTVYAPTGFIWGLCMFRFVLHTVCAVVGLFCIQTPPPPPPLPRNHPKI